MRITKILFVMLLCVAILASTAIPSFANGELLAQSPAYTVGTTNTMPTTSDNPIDSASDWARAGITSALEKGFVPAEIQNNYTNVITRAEFCRLAVSWLEYATGKSIDTVLSEKGLSRNENAFSDTNDPTILAAYALGITNGKVVPSSTAPGIFDPNGQLDREQAAVMVMNTCRAYGANIENPPTSDFTDLNTASGWSVPGINFVRAHVIMSGITVTPPTFSPKSNYTRQQSILTFGNIKHNELPKAPTQPTPMPTPTPTPTTTTTPRQGHYTVRYGPRGGAICWCGRYMSQH